MQKRLSFTQNSFITLCTSLSILVIGFVRNIILARVLGPSGKGQLDILFTAAMLLVIFGNLGLTNANIYFLGKKKEENDSIIGNLLVFCLVCSIILLIIYYVLPQSIFQRGDSAIDSTSRIIASLFIPLILFHMMFIGIFQGKKLFVRYNIFIALQHFLSVLFIILLITFTDLDLLRAVTALVASYVIVDLLIVLSLGKIVTERIRFNGKLLSESMKFGIKSQLGTILQYFNYRLDIFIVNHFHGHEAVGFYGISVVFAEVLSKIPGSVGTILFPTISSKGEIREITKFTEKVCRITLTLTVTAGIVMMLLGGYFIRFFYTDRFASSVEPMILLVPGVAVLSIANVLGSNLTGRGYPHYPALCTGMGLVITIILDFILIPRYTINGAALASTCSYCTTTLSFLFFYKLKTESRLRDLLIVKKEDFKIIGDKIKQLREGKS